MCSIGTSKARGCRAWRAHERSDPGRRAFTLLETLMAVAVLSMLIAAATSAWVQVSASADDSVRLARLQRAEAGMRLLEDQWADRRLGLTTSTVPALTISPDGIRFVTATPALFRESPLVIANYSLEPSEKPGSGEGPWFDLVYEENRVADMSSPSMRLTDKRGRVEPNKPPTKEEASRRRVLRLLEGVRGLRVERFGEAWETATPQTLSMTRYDSRGRLFTRPAVQPQRETNERISWRWRPLEDGYQGLMPAVRIIGERDGREVAAVIVLGSSYSVGQVKVDTRIKQNDAGSGGVGGGGAGAQTPGRNGP